MHALMNHPAVQGGLAPFLVALIAAELFQRLRLSGLAVIAGFATTVYLVSGFAFEPLTATRKIVLLGLAASILGALLSWLAPRWARTALAIAGGVAALWMADRILQYQTIPNMLLWGAGCAFYTAWLVYWMDELQGDAVRAASAGLALGLGSGLAALFGASALLGLFGLSLGAAAGAVLLILMVTGSSLPCGRSFTLSLSLIAALSACLGVLTAELPWYALPLLAAIPLAAKIPVPAKSALWLQSLLLSAATLLVAAGAVYLTWRVAGAPPI